MASEKSHHDQLASVVGRLEQQSPGDTFTEHDATDRKKTSMEYNDVDSGLAPTEIGTVDSEKTPAQESQDGSSHSASPNEPLPLSKLLLIGVGIWFAIFLYSLDQTIVSNAIPSITDEFHSIDDIGWYGSSYLLTTAAFQLFYGRVYSNFSIKYAYLAAIFIFELGSLVCALAPTSTALIIGRAVAGVGCAGIASGSMVIIAHSFPARARPMCIASVGIIFAVAAVLGPILGGVFTTQLTWRWCFWINLPFGGATMLVILFFLPDPKRPQIDSLSLNERLKKIDLIGLLIFIPAVVCLLLALQWGGSTYAWNSGRIIALLVLFPVILAAFLTFEYWKGAEASLPIRIITKRSVAAATLNGFCNLAAFLILIYYIPFWQQVVRGASAENAGIRLLPFVLGVVVMANLSGAMVTKFGYYAPMMILSSIITPIGIGLLTTWTVNTGFSEWVGYQAMAGMGFGLGQQQPLVAMQTVLSKADVPAGTSIIMLVQTLSGAIFVSVGQSVLQNEFRSNLERAFSNDSLNITSLVAAGATQVRSLVSPQDLDTVLVAYNNALTKVYMVALILSCITIIGSLTIEWKSIKKVKE